jgi:hypothetical protein
LRNKARKRYQETIKTSRQKAQKTTSTITGSLVFIDSSERFMIGGEVKYAIKYQSFFSTQQTS